MTTTSEQYCILVPIDTLLDTHMGTAARLSSESVVDMTVNGYHVREDNDLWNYTDKFTKDLYIKLWNNRDLTTLRYSVITKLPEYIKGLLHYQMIKEDPTSAKKNIIVKINSYPYILSDVLKNEFKDIFAVLIDNLAEIEMVHISNAGLTVEKIKEMELNSIISVDFIEWVELHLDEIYKERIKDVTVVAPMITRATKVKYTELLESGKIDKEIASSLTVYEAVSMLFVPYLDVVFLPVSIFSLPDIR